MNKTKIIVTIDTEALTQGALSIEEDIYGEIGKERYGVEKIMDRCDAYGYRATFFVDVPEHHLFGRSAITELCKCIDRRGHDVQLHIHPNHFPGKSKKFMWQYDFATQKAMIRQGKEVIEDAIGKSPVAFRAGSYGANLSTIRALADNDIRIDSSYFTFHKNCDLSRELKNKYKNVVFTVNGVTEIPVTVYKLLDMFLYEDYSKIDINACSREEICYVIDKLAGKVEVLILFLHSFSFLKWDSRRKYFVPDSHNITKFDDILRAIACRNDVEVVTMAGYCQTMVMAPVADMLLTDFIPTSKFMLNFHRLASRYIRQ